MIQAMLLYIRIIVTVMLIFFSILYSLLAYNSFYRNWFVEWMTAKANTAGMKPDIEGERVYVPRRNKRDVRVNLYRCPPGKHVVYLCHGGDFLNGDPDDLDAFCMKVRDLWQANIVSIGYSLVDVHVTTYPQEEITDTILYFQEHAEEYGFGNKAVLLGFDAGAYLAAISAVQLVQKGCILNGHIYCYPYVDYVQTSFAKAGYHVGPVAMVAAGEEKQLTTMEEYEKTLSDAGIPCRMKVYPDEKRNFIEDGKGRSEEALSWLKERIGEFTGQFA